MLVLSRNLNQEIWIDGGRIKIIVVQIRSDKVRLGIEAPADMPVHRQEVQEVVDREARAKEIQERKRSQEGGVTT